VQAPAASGAVALNAKSESTGVNDPAVLLTWIAKLADPSADKTPLLQVTSRKPVLIPIITITGGTGKMFHVPGGNDTVYWPTAVLLELNAPQCRTQGCRYRRRSR
jgi:hypothetical protein